MAFKAMMAMIAFWNLGESTTVLARAAHPRDLPSQPAAVRADALVVHAALSPSAPSRAIILQAY
jgi:hypothetical protein